MNRHMKILKIMIIVKRKKKTVARQDKSDVRIDRLKLQNNNNKYIRESIMKIGYNG